MKKNIYTIIILLILGIGVFLFIGLDKKENVSKEGNNVEIVGGDKDEHGCIGSAGYSWCEEKNKCLRIWEEPCQQDIENPNSPINEDENIVVPEEFDLTESSCVAMSGVWYLYNKTCEVNYLSQSGCLALGGEFNECNSACRHTPDAEICTMQCVVTCTLR